MTTKCLDNQVCTSKILLSWRFPRKNSVLDDFPLCPSCPPKSAIFVFLVVSPSLIIACGEYQQSKNTVTISGSSTQRSVNSPMGTSHNGNPQIPRNRQKPMHALNCWQPFRSCHMKLLQWHVLRIKFSPPPPTPEFLAKDFPSATKSRTKFLLRRTWSGQKLLPLQFPGLSLP